MLKTYEFLVVGGGIAASTVAFKLLKRGRSFQMITDPTLLGASEIAAGLINPITGRNFVKSWKIETLLKSSVQTYLEMELLLKAKILNDVGIIRVLKNHLMINEWTAREMNKSYAEFIDLNKGNILAGIHLKKHFGRIKGAKRINFSLVINGIRNVLKENNCLSLQNFNTHPTIIKEGLLQYKNAQYHHIIFCTGVKATQSLLWSYLPFVPAKGERLIIHSPNLKLKDVYNDGKIIIPLDDDQYWVGSNYEWDDLNTKPTEKEKEKLIKFLDKTIDVPYSVIDHSAHIRPSTYNRRPFVGRHPIHPNYFILNGLGAKGASLAPYCADQLINHIINGTDLDPEIDIKRVERR